VARGELAGEKRRGGLYQVGVSLAVLVVVSLASVKRDDYILPAIPGIAILCASVFTLDVRSWAAKLCDLIVAVFVLAPIFVVLFFIFYPDHAPSLTLQSSDLVFYSFFRANVEAVTRSFLQLIAVWLAASAIEAFALVRRRVIASGAAFGLLALSQSLFWTATLRPDVAAARSVKSFVPIVVEHVKADQLCIAGGINYELSYYYGAGVPDIGNPRCAYLIATPREMDAMTPEYRARLRLVAKSNLVGGGGAPALFEISPAAAK